MTIAQAQSAAEAAAIWWANIIATPPPLDNGVEDTKLEVMKIMSATSRRDPTTEQLETFKSHLIRAVNDRLDDAGEYGVVISVDYSPDHTLQTAIERSGVPGGIADWPWKTTMVVREDSVEVWCGYGAPAELVWGRLDAD